jgi:hypothetical protein
VLDHKAKLKPAIMGAILIQLKNNNSFTEHPQRHLFDAMHPIRLGIIDKDTNIPFIHIVFALASRVALVQAMKPTGRVASNTTTSGDGPWMQSAALGASITQKFVPYNIWCSGTTHETFACIDPVENNTYNTLLQRILLMDMFAQEYNLMSEEIVRGNLPLAIERKAHLQSFSS